MWQSIIAVIGTLAGATLTGAMQTRAARATRAADHAEALRQAAVEAVIALAVAVSDHRRTMWMLGDAQLAGAADDRLLDLQAETHRTRSAITAPAARVQLLVRDEGLRDAARTAITATYAMRDPETPQALTRLRADALTAHDAMVDAASRILA
ncbi:hypothetical protein [Streptomyces sp. M10]|uniref:hypothetical protein n=1 Tax=Streptomyces sp. M10 TaxID=412968 RepID=UPI000648394E|nr:hypothetical protein [Streptomyces sp. M10]